MEPATGQKVTSYCGRASFSWIFGKKIFTERLKISKGGQALD